MKTYLAAVALCLGLGACSSVSGVPQQPADPKVVAAIGDACADSGLFKLADGTLSTFIPAVNLPVAVINAGVDKVCSDPAAFASDVSTVEWVVKNTLAAVKGSTAS